MTLFGILEKMPFNQSSARVYFMKYMKLKKRNCNRGNGLFLPNKAFIL